MRHIRTLTNNWPRGELRDLTCREHNEFEGVCPLSQSKVESCKSCKDNGTARFYYARHFILELNSRRNRRITQYTHALYTTLRKRKLTGAIAQKVINNIAAFYGIGAPNWKAHWLPMPSQHEILRHWGLPSTETMIAKRRANLLGSLVRHHALPKNDISSAGRASWGNQAVAGAGHMKLTLDDAHNITFWRNAVRKATN